MLTRSLFLFFSLLLSYTCTEPRTVDHFDKERQRVVHSALKKFVKSMRAKGYYAAGIGEGLDHSCYPKRQNYLGVTFDIEQLPNVDFARKIEVESINEFLNIINTEEGIQDYIAEYPYPVRFLQVTFISRNRTEGLCAVSNCEDKVYYDQDDPDKPIGPSIEIHCESFEEAVRILEQYQENSGV